jgi:hypothetical protein
VYNQHTGSETNPYDRISRPKKSNSPGGLAIISRKTCYRLISATCLLLLVATDLNAARRSLRIDFDAWGRDWSFKFDNAFCPYHYSGSALDYIYRELDSLYFQNLQDDDPYTAFMYCQNIPEYESGMQTNEYLNSEVIPSDEPGLAAKIGTNLDGHVRAVRYTFLDGGPFSEGTTGYQWAFYQFSGGILIVALYTDLPVLAGGFSPAIYFETNPDYSIETYWSAQESGIDGQYFCFDMDGADPEFIGIWDGEVAGTNPADGCTLDYVSSREALVALYNATDGANWTNNSNWLSGDPCDNDWFGVGCGNQGVYCDAEEGAPPEPGDTCYGLLRDIMGINLSGNNLVGTIPPELGRSGLPDQLQELYLDGNQLGGSIPAELGNLPLYSMWLAGNQLVGIVPSELCDLNLLDGWSTRYNRLQNPAVSLCGYQDVAHQTVSPLGLVVTTAEAPNIALSWNAIDYTADTGRYRAWYSTSPDGPFVDGGATANKSETSLTIDGLDPYSIYYILIRTETDAHAGNPNNLESEDSNLLRVLFEKIFNNGFE